MFDQDPATTLRLRILLSLGLGTTTLAGCTDPGDGVRCEIDTHRVTVSLADVTDAPTDDTGDTASSSEECPAEPYEAGDRLTAPLGLSCQVDNLVLVEQSGEDCTYEFTCYTCCGYGRPYLDERGVPVEAETDARADWLDPARAPEPQGLTPAQRAEVGRYWRENARAEHSSVAGFHRFALELLAHGAPPELVARAQRAAGQELRHAIDCFTLASRYAGAPIGPGKLEMGGHAPVAATLAELAVFTARDGAVGETLAAFLAARALDGATDPAVRAVLERIVRDETEHAELAWATLRWALVEGGPEVRDALDRFFAQLGDPRPQAVDWAPALAAHGVLSPEQERAHAERCIAGVIRPVARSLLAAGTPDTRAEPTASA